MVAARSDLYPPPEDEQLERLALLPSTTVRGLEVLFHNRATRILLSSKTERDLKEYLCVIEPVYGNLDAVEVPAKLDFLKAIPRLTGVAFRQRHNPPDDFGLGLASSFHNQV